MATAPNQLLTLGLFVFGMDTIAYDEFRRRTSWRHAQTERFGARPASQFTGPGDDTVTIGAKLIPEIAGSYSAIDTLRDMADSGDSWLLIDGLGGVIGKFRIDGIDEEHRAIMAGGIPRAKSISIEMTRID